MRQKIFTFLTSPIAVISSFIITILLLVADNNLGYFFAFFVVLIALWGSKFKWLEFGLGKTNIGRTALRAIAYAVLLFVVLDIGIQPLVEYFTEPVDLSNFDGLRGNVISMSIMMVIMWVFAAFGEEFIYRGYFTKRIALIMGNTNASWLGAAVITSIVFGAAHYYQGPAGMIATGVAGFYFAYLFIKNRSNLLLPILVHGFYDMIGLTLIYYSQERIFSDWVLGLLR